MSQSPIARHSALADTAYFLRRWVKEPFLIGAVAPSGRGLSNGMAAPVDPVAPGTVIELGAGTGNMTQSLLNRGVPLADLLSVEKDSEMHRRLAERFSGIRAVQGDAADIAAIAAAQRLDRVKAVVSGLPLIGMPYDIRRRIVAGVFDVLAEGGIFVQFTYTLVSPVHPSIMDSVGIEGRWVQRIWLNIPPARVWVYHRRTETAIGL